MRMPPDATILSPRLQHERSRTVSGPVAENVYDVIVIGAGPIGYTVVGRARAAGLDPEAELRAAARAYRERVVAWEREQRAVDS